MSVALAQQPAGMRPRVVAPLPDIVAEPEIEAGAAPDATQADVQPDAPEASPDREASPPPELSDREVLEPEQPDIEREIDALPPPPPPYAQAAPRQRDRELAEAPPPPRAAPRWRDPAPAAPVRPAVADRRLPDLRAEVAGWVRARFATLDRDGDGFLVELELAMDGDAPIRRPLRERLAERRQARRDAYRDRYEDDRYGYGDRYADDGSYAYGRRGPGYDGDRGDEGYYEPESRDPTPRALANADMGAAFARMDRNRDGAVSLNEAINGALERFDRLDGDGDGVIEADERGSRRSRRFAGLDRSRAAPRRPAPIDPDSF